MSFVPDFVSRRPPLRDMPPLGFDNFTPVPKGRISPTLRVGLTATPSAQSAMHVDPIRQLPDPALVAMWGPARCLRERLLPWRKTGACTIILTSQPAQFARHVTALNNKFGPVRMAVTSDDHLNRAVCLQFDQTLIRRAENRVPAQFSCRDWGKNTSNLRIFAIFCSILAVTFAVPIIVLSVLTMLAVCVLILQMTLKTAAVLTTLRHPAPERNAAVPARLPVVSILVPLFREKAIANHLLHRLRALDYPRDRLDVCLIVEATDQTTRTALGETNLPSWLRVVRVPAGAVQTKPRALNYALDFARGSIIGIYDAEDAPAPDQLRKVVDRFANRGPQVACLQGVLDYYNTSSNWMTRCFTVEYASWFRVILPGLARMGLVIPLGGTTLFFRREALENLGGWDAHNVTEDADLGIRLARQGYSTELIATTTEEEANGRVWPWIKQRSRWIKGYAVTYGVHMRDPVALWRDLGAWRFCGLQVQFAGTLIGFLLAPLLLSFWMIAAGLPHPMHSVLQGPVLWAMVGLFVTSYCVNIAIGVVGLKRADKMRFVGWVPTLHFYYPLAAIAAYKGFWQLINNPFYWDKTRHGILLTSEAARLTAQPQPQLHPASAA